MEIDSSTCKIPFFVLSFGAVVLNMAMIWFVWIRKHVEGRFRKLLINLGIIDILFIVSTLLRVYIHESDNYPYSLVITRSLFKYTRWVRFISLLWIVIERVLAVYKPMKFRTKYSRYSICKILVLLWLLPFVYNVLAGIQNGTTYPRRKNYIAISAHALVLIILSCLNILLPVGIAKQARVSIALFKRKSKIANTAGKNRFNRERKAAILAFTIVSAFILCSIPVIVVQFWYETTVPVIVASCNITSSRIMISTSFLIVLDIVVDPIVYFFGNPFSSLCLDRNVRARNLNAVCGAKKISNVMNRSPKVSKDENSFMENAVPLEALAKNVSNCRIVSKKARSNEFMTDEVIPHMRGSQKENVHVSEMIEIKEVSKVGDSGGVIECSSYTNKVMKRIELNELPGLYMPESNESDLHNSNIYQTTVMG